MGLEDARSRSLTVYFFDALAAKEAAMIELTQQQRQDIATSGWSAMFFWLKSRLTTGRGARNDRPWSSSATATTGA
jgi:hypothetical protein